MSEGRKIGIIGCGPRGLHVIEQLFIQWDYHCDFNCHLIIFEKEQHPGAGQVYRLQQSKSNWMNVPLRNLFIPHRPKIQISNLQIDAFPDFQTWYEQNCETSQEKIDHFPLRRELGRYLHERFKTIYDVLNQHSLIQIIHEEVVDIDIHAGKEVSIVTLNDQKIMVDHVLLALGHQPLKRDAQLQQWIEQLNETHRLIEEPFPMKKWLTSIPQNERTKIGLRGFGLTAIDVLRNIQDDTSDSRNSWQIIPFAKEEEVPVPKPLNKEVDQNFDLSRNQKAYFKHIVRQSESGNEEDQKLNPVLKAIARISREVYLSTIRIDPDNQKWNHGDIEEAILDWFKDAKLHPFFEVTESKAVNQLKEYIEMARGQSECTLDYCVGQVWRKLQPTMYEAFSFINWSDNELEKMIDLNERMKRYAYGPPVQSIEMILELIKSRNLNLDLLGDPDIETCSDGWILQTDTAKTKIDFLVDTVLASPSIQLANTDLCRNLLEKGYLREGLSDKGAEIDQDGHPISKDGSPVLQLSLIGRLGKGDYFGVDAIIECFGYRERLVAQAMLRRCITN